MQPPTKDVTFSDLMIHVGIGGCLTAIAIWSRMRAIQQAARRCFATPNLSDLS
jgi:uncharacterized protein (DUF2461 family)